VKILLVEDCRTYLEGLSKLLVAEFGVAISIDEASDYSSAHKMIDLFAYDLVIADLDIPEGESVGSRADPEIGMELLKELNRSERNEFCARLVLTGYGTAPRTREALKNLGVYDFLDKSLFDQSTFLSTVKKALFDALTRKATALRRKKYLLSVSFTDTHLTALELQGPDRYQSYLPSDPVHFEAKELSRRTDRLNLFFTSFPEKEARLRWREEARSIGKNLYDSLMKSDAFVSGLSAARNLPRREGDLWLRFRGPRTLLSVPFELLYNLRFARMKIGF
jgi:DNA-binding NarL/FixJ family response regulator